MSKTIVIEVIDVATPSFVKTAKGGYNVVEIAFKQEGKVGGKKIVDFAAPDVYKAVLGLKSKDIANVVIEKEEGRDGKEYWQWKSVDKGTGDSASGDVSSSDSPRATGPIVSGAKAPGRVTGSNYETPDERTARQLLIVRQSSVTAALKFYEQTEADVGRQEVVELAEFFKDYVYNGVSAAEKPAKAKAAKAKPNPALEESANEDGDIPF